jgi:hypothetical protein
MPADGNNSPILAQAAKAYAKAASLMETPPNPWTTYDELTPAQRERYGDYVRAKGQFRKACANGRVIEAKTQEAFRETGGDKVKAFALLVGRM